MLNKNVRVLDHAAKVPAAYWAPTELRRSITRMGRLLGASMSRDGELSPAKLSALGIVRRHGPMTASALAGRLGIRQQSLTRMLTELEEAGLLDRTRDLDDSREINLTVTSKARLLMDQEGVRRDRLMREAMQAVLTDVEIELLLVAGKALHKLADGWTARGRERMAPVRESER